MADRKRMYQIDDKLLEMVAGGQAIFPACKVHDWVFTGSYTDMTNNATWNCYKCSKCSREKTERA